ncbi:hypothetical protein AMJ39_08610 [candidate division TA06 bacterium DG_24]|uniref:Outer membrane protein beta-barrel domain-containing protein n=1 Tax=candidate division TA06 bacterium DG_24 TaxID=1703770 RepID=A0A0S7WPP3_UNCT6|nr:MAG: hypothetical protein AMJ39_08610 [candidate division TA06 bacterium DG_24]
MQRILAGLTILLLLVAASSSLGEGYAGMLGIGVGGGIAQVMGDDIDNYNFGPNMGLHVKYGIVPSWSLVGSFNYTWNTWSEDSKAKLVYMPFSLGAVYDFSSLMPPDTRWVPCLEGCLGLYQWKAEYDGETVVDPLSNEKLEASSLGLCLGAGVEIFPMQSLGISPNFRFHYIFSADQDKWGTEDDNEYLWDAGVGVTWYWPIGQSTPAGM